ncbi:hypothetical protein PVAP13_6KG197900 [Panicum virgatum]|uniref:Uncharacterized protein n=1 Tax=Panicum virgatum TaxID=38727 RepID=A0A8T0RCB9_PANVG|nr:hypothetical protein PVAP13_6KG197900 [Panicum virgatum]
MTMPASATSPTSLNTPATSPTTSPTSPGPITRSRAKKIQQEVHALLCETHLALNENYILPKLCILLLLRFAKEDNKDPQDDEHREESRSDQAGPAEPSERNNHNF